MSGILAFSGLRQPPRMREALARLAFLGGDEERTWSDSETTVAVSRKAWELSDDFSGPVLLLERPDLLVAADASLYHRDTLRRDLAAAGIAADGSSASHLIAAAYRAWGVDAVEHLSGDYAFIVWDVHRRRMLAARDPVGTRPLYHAATGDGIACASSSRALAELLSRDSHLNLECLGAAVAGLAYSIGRDTAFEGVHPLPPGHRLLFENGRARVECFWQPPVAPDSRPAPIEEAADELRMLLSRAVTDRLAAGTTTVWMSGGYDSTAVFAAGQDGLRKEDRGRLRPVSISYPVGDPGREDEFIGQAASHWKADVHWISSDDIPLLEGLEHRAGASDEPPAHLYELWNRALARGTRAVGSRVALEGGGGDQLFQVSDVVLADFLRSGRVGDFVRMARSRDWRHVARVGILPLLPERVMRSAERLRGRPLRRHYMERSQTEWVRPEFAERHRLRERDLSSLRDARGSSPAHRESTLYVTLPVWSYGASYMRGALLQEGVEFRSPLLDRAVMEFALRRPVSERASALGTKTLLRRAMRGLLPQELLEPRTRRTGMTVGFSRRRMNEAYPALLSKLFSEPLRLAELGIVEPAKLRAAAERFCSGAGDEFLRVNLFHTMKTEFWLRGFERRADTGIIPAVGVNRVLSAAPAA